MIRTQPTDWWPGKQQKSINDISLPDRSSNRLRGDATMFGTIYVCDVTNNEILETIFSREELHYDELILEGEVESSDDESDGTETFPYDLTVSAFLLRFFNNSLILF